MTDAAFLLSILEDGQPHSTDEILAKSQAERGVGLMVHSRASDLRKRGHVITCDLAGRRYGRPIYVYTLLGSLPESSSQSATPSSTSPEVNRNDHSGRGDGSGSEQEQLFESPTKPAWA